MNREELLRAAATLDTASLAQRALLASGRYKDACVASWLTDEEAEQQALDFDADTEVPVFDFLTQGPIEKSDLVVLSDGRCYARSSIRALVESGNDRDASTNRTRLPLTRALMTDLDYALVDLDAPRPNTATSAAVRDAAPDADVQQWLRAQQQREAREQLQQRQAMREQAAREDFLAQQFVRGQGRPSIEAAAGLGRAADYNAMRQLFAQMQGNERLCALFAYAHTYPGGGADAANNALGEQLQTLAASQNVTLADLLEREQPQCVRYVGGRLKTYVELIALQPERVVAVLRNLGDSSNADFLVQLVLEYARADIVRRAFAHYVQQRGAADNNSNYYIVQVLFARVWPMATLSAALQAYAQTPTAYAKAVDIVNLVRPLESWSEDEARAFLGDTFLRAAPLWSFYSDPDDLERVQRLVYLFDVLDAPTDSVKLLFKTVALTRDMREMPDVAERHARVVRNLIYDYVGGTRNRTEQETEQAERYWLDFVQNELGLAL